MVRASCHRKSRFRSGRALTADRGVAGDDAATIVLIAGDDNAAMLIAGSAISAMMPIVAAVAAVAYIAYIASVASVAVRFFPIAVWSCDQQLPSTCPDVRKHVYATWLGCLGGFVRRALTNYIVLEESAPTATRLSPPP